MKFERRFTTIDRPVAEQIRWKTVPVAITGKAAAVPEVEVPEGWSQNAANILADKYLRKAGVPSPVDLVAYHADDDGMPEWLYRSIVVTGHVTKTGPETSAKQVFHRLAGAWTYWGWREGYFLCVQGKTRAGCEQSEDYARIFYDEVYWCLAMQLAAPNSPQWFNTGLHWAYGIEGPDTGMWRVDNDHRDKKGNREPYRVHNSYEHPQPHACFLTPVIDDLVNEGGIMDAWVREARIFKHGSGSGINPSVWRGKDERLSGGGRASGVMSWLKIGDAAAGAVQSGGTTRRAAKMVALDPDHPEVEEFVDWKVKEEYKAAAMDVGAQVLRMLTSGEQQPRVMVDGIGADVAVPQPMLDRIRNGFKPEALPAAWESEAIRTVDGQNSNNSLRPTDEFMRVSADANGLWELRARTTGKVVKVLNAADLWERICRSAWATGDPGLLFHDTINAWNTCAADGEIRTTNPCFTGDTKVWTSKGPRRFDELAKECNSVPVLTELFDGKLAYRNMVSPRLTRRTAKIVKLTLNSQGSCKTVGRRKGVITRLRLTGNHEVFLSDGTRRRAEDLRPGDSIESVYRQKANQAGYISLRTTSGDNVMEHHVAVEYTHGRRPQWPYEHGHHLDEIKDRNVPGNIEIVSASVHNSEHMRGDRNPMRRWFNSLSTEEQTIHRQKFSKPGSLNPNFGNNKMVGRVWINNGHRCKRIYPTDPIPDGWSQGYLRLNNTQSEITRQKRADSVRAAWARRRAVALNHTVISVEVLEEREDVYCGTVPSTGRFFISLGDNHSEGILVSNCAEFHHLDGSACNLASLNLVGFLNEDGTINLDAYQHACRLWTIVLDISVSMASFPAREFAVGAYNYRTLGLGYMNLGGLLMRLALPYDSDEGRALAAGLTALMTGVAYQTSAELAEELGPFPRWEANEVPFRAVMRKHYDALDDLRGDNVKLATAATLAWIAVQEAKSFRNAQTTLLAPTGTIHLVTDCDTSGLEPDYALVKHKNLAGGGSMRIVNQGVEPALKRMGYVDFQIRDILAGLEEHGRFPSAPNWLRELSPDNLDRHLAVFACVADLDPMAHVKMVAAIQPFLSGAASKTINLPPDATVEDVSRVYREMHRLGVKAVALYRDGSKLTQPLRAAKPTEKVDTSDIPEAKKARLVQSSDGALSRGKHEYLPWRRTGGYTQKMKIGDDALTVFVHTGEYPDGRLGEVFIELAHEGTTLRAAANCLAIAISIALQHGTPLEALVDKLLNTKFEPSGYVEGHDRIRFAHSFADLIARDLAITYLGRDDLANTVQTVPMDGADAIVALDKRALAISKGQVTGEVCRDCGGLMVQTGTCLTCSQCGANNGCGG